MLPELRLLATVALAMVLGGLIGIEREMADKPAGFRTQMLVSGAAALLVALVEPMLEHFHRVLPSAEFRSDPLRIVEAIVTGIGFLGAGTIFRRSSSDQVQGLTTAASLLFSAAVGVAVAVELYGAAIGSTLLVLIVLRALGIIDRRVRQGR